MTSLLLLVFNLFSIVLLFPQLCVLMLLNLALPLAFANVWWFSVHSSLHLRLINFKIFFTCFHGEHLDRSRAYSLYHSLSSMRMSDESATQIGCCHEQTNFPCLGSTNQEPTCTAFFWGKAEGMVAGHIGWLFPLKYYFSCLGLCMLVSGIEHPWESPILYISPKSSWAVRYLYQWEV